MKRRRFITQCSIAATGAWAAPAILNAQGIEHQPDLPSFDKTMTEYMRLRGIPGGALGVLKTAAGRRGGQNYFKGYGFADRDKKIPVTPTSLFRIASVSKPITGVAIMKLVETGKLKLDDLAFDYIELEPILSLGAKFDKRIDKITIRQLLQHTGGWDRNASFDPMFRSKRISEIAGTRGPADAKTVIRYMLGKPLDFDPGTKYAYSNFGYNVLGRIIEKVTGKGYEEWVRTNILLPNGIKSMRIGRTMDGLQAPCEVRYYMPKNEKGASVFPDLPGHVDWPYGAFNLEAMDAHGAWIASVEDLIGYAHMLDRPELSKVLSAESIKELYRPPAAPVSRGESGKLNARYYGLGWNVRLVGNKGSGANYWHGGSLPGTYTLLVRRWDGFSWVALFNQRNGNKQHPDSAIDPALHRAANAVKGWD